jgi:hypothetical protein
MYSTIFTISIAVFGITFTLFTLFFSFIFSKREELRSIKNSVIEGKTTLETQQKEKFAIRHILKLKNINKHILILLCFSFIISVSSFLCKNLKSICFEIIFIVLTIFLISYLVVLFFIIVIYYKKSTKI